MMIIIMIIIINIRWSGSTSIITRSNSIIIGLYVGIAADSDVSVSPTALR